MIDCFGGESANAACFSEFATFYPHVALVLSSSVQNIKAKRYKDSVFSILLNNKLINLCLCICDAAIQNSTTVMCIQSNCKRVKMCFHHCLYLHMCLTSAHACFSMETRHVLLAPPPSPWPRPFLWSSCSEQLLQFNPGLTPRFPLSHPLTREETEDPPTSEPTELINVGQRTTWPDFHLHPPNISWSPRPTLLWKEVSLQHGEGRRKLWITDLSMFFFSHQWQMYRNQYEGRSFTQAVCVDFASVVERCGSQRKAAASARPAWFTARCSLSFLALQGETARGLPHVLGLSRCALNASHSQYFSYSELTGKLPLLSFCSSSRPGGHISQSSSSFPNLQSSESDWLIPLENQGQPRRQRGWGAVVIVLLANAKHSLCVCALCKCPCASAACFSGLGNPVSFYSRRMEIIYTCTAGSQPSHLLELDQSEPDGLAGIRQVVFIFF